MTDPKGGVVIKDYDSEGRPASILSRNDLLRPSVRHRMTADRRDVEQRRSVRPSRGGDLDEGLRNGWSLTSASKSDGTTTTTYSYRYDSQDHEIHVVEPYGVSLDFGYDENGYRNW